MVYLLSKILKIEDLTKDNGSWRTLITLKKNKKFSISVFKVNQREWALKKAQEFLYALTHPNNNLNERVHEKLFPLYDKMWNFNAKLSKSEFLNKISLHSVNIMPNATYVHYEDGGILGDKLITVKLDKKLKILEVYLDG